MNSILIHVIRAVHGLMLFSSGRSVALRRIRFLELKSGLRSCLSNGVPFDIAEYRDARGESHRATGDWGSLRRQSVRNRGAPAAGHREMREWGGGAIRRSALGGRR